MEQILIKYPQGLKNIPCNYIYFSEETGEGDYGDSRQFKVYRYFIKVGHKY